MKYTPYSEAELASMNVFPEGLYPFQVLEVQTIDKFGQPLIDKNGVDMAKIKLLIWAENKKRELFTYLSGDGLFAFKLRHYARTIGMIDAYEAGTFNINLTVGKRGVADIVIKKGTTKADGSGEVWPDRNDVKDFIHEDNNKQGATAIPLNQIPPKDDLDDGIPF